MVVLVAPHMVELNGGFKRYDIPPLLSSEHWSASLRNRDRHQFGTLIAIPEIRRTTEGRILGLRSVSNG